MHPEGDSDSRNAKDGQLKSSFREDLYEILVAMYKKKGTVIEEIRFCKLGLFHPDEEL